jgi:hypothetical protein
MERNPQCDIIEDEEEEEEISEESPLHSKTPPAKHARMAWEYFPATGKTVLRGLTAAGREWVKKQEEEAQKKAELPPQNE